MRLRQHIRRLRFERLRDNQAAAPPIDLRALFPDYAARNNTLVDVVCAYMDMWSLVPEVHPVYGTRPCLADYQAARSLMMRARRGVVAMTPEHKLAPPALCQALRAVRARGVATAEY